ncbi:hypothetical protein M422DRAFT_200255 [Sphaerobolus stellatus SS14]|nr:hypothetical protein M422DRAFT_200255 [Sphaerobolus stellatus SS14]
MDWALLPWVRMSFLYLLSFLDRSAIGNARLYHLETDLHINDTQYNLALTIFFFSYVPSNIFLKRLRPSIWFSFLVLMWGIMMTLQGLVHNYGGLLGLRWMLGIFEAGLFPGVTFYLSCWYKRSEFGIRAALFFSAATVSGAFGGLLAAAISKMNGIGGKPAWAWIFILEGLVTILAGVASFWIVQDFPDTAKFLTDKERAFVVWRLQQDGQFSAGGEKLKWDYIVASLKDWKTWNGMHKLIILFRSIMPLYSFSLFLPTIISHNKGFKATPANLLTVPVYAFACVLTCAVGYFADKIGNRGYFNLGFFVIAAAGYIILIVSRNSALSYFATFLAASGIYPLVCTAWFSNNVEGSYKRSVGLAVIVSFANLNGAVSSNVYRAEDKPWFRLGHGLVLLYICIGWISSLVAIILLRRENAARERGERDEIIRGVTALTNPKSSDQKIYDSLDQVKSQKGDEWSGYRYTL